MIDKKNKQESMDFYINHATGQVILPGPDLSKNHKEGNEFIDSKRGRYIMAQALNIAIRYLKAKPYQLREMSNIEDMEFIRNTLFHEYSWETIADMIDSEYIEVELKKRQLIKENLKNIGSRPKKC